MTEGTIADIFGWMAEEESKTQSVTQSVSQNTAGSGALLFVFWIFMICGTFVFLMGIVWLLKPDPLSRRSSAKWPQATGRICDRHHHYIGNRGGFSRYSKAYYYTVEFYDASGRRAVGTTQDFKGELPFQPGQSVTIGVGPAKGKAPVLVQKLSDLLDTAMHRLLSEKQDQSEPLREYCVRIRGDEARKREVKCTKTGALVCLFLGIHVTLLSLFLYFNM